MAINCIRTWITLQSILIGVCVEAKFNFTVHFYEYWNPTGLCGECGGVLDDVPRPACCDDTEHTENCSNTGVFRCDTGFRYVLRPYGALVTTAPNKHYEYFTQSITNENHETFNVGPGGFLTLPNPHTITNNTAWTGRIQLHIDALDRAKRGSNETQRIIDRFPIDLELQLGANLTQQTPYFGIYNISQLDMSFRVQCSEHYYGPDCNKLCEPVGEKYTCDSDGNTTCIQRNYDILTDCMKCLPGRDISTNCSECLPGRNLSTNCVKCLFGYVGQTCFEDPCHTEPCKNEGACVTNTITGEYHCTCAGGYMGIKCGLRISRKVTSVSDIVLGVLLILSIATIFTLIVVIIVMRRSHKRTTKQDVTELSHMREEGYGTTGHQSDQSSKEAALVEDANVNADAYSPIS